MSVEMIVWMVEERMVVQMLDSGGSVDSVDPVDFIGSFDSVHPISAGISAGTAGVADAVQSSSPTTTSPTSTPRLRRNTAIFEITFGRSTELRAGSMSVAMTRYPREARTRGR